MVATRPYTSSRVCNGSCKARIGHCRTTIIHPLRFDCFKGIYGVIQRYSSDLASYQKKVVKIDSHVGVGFSGLTSDARVLRYDRLNTVTLCGQRLCVQEWFTIDFSQFLELCQPWERRLKSILSDTVEGLMVLDYWLLVMTYNSINGRKLDRIFTNARHLATFLTI